MLKRALAEWDGKDYDCLETIYTRLLGTVMYVKGGLSASTSTARFGAIRAVSENSGGLDAENFAESRKTGVKPI